LFNYTLHIIVVQFTTTTTTTINSITMPSTSATNSTTKPGRQELKGLGPIISTSRRSTQTQTQRQTQVQPEANHVEPVMSSKRQAKYQRRIREALKDLESLGPIVTTSRLRSHAAHPNADYVQSLRNAAADALPRGGLRTRSGHHYDRSF
jgi:hypothetical protein